MAQQIIGIGEAPNDGTGDNLRTAGQKINENFEELYGAIVDHWRGAWDPTGDVFPVDGDGWGSGSAGILAEGDEGYLTADAFLESVDGTPGGDDWNAYATIRYLGSGVWLIKA